MSHDLKGVMLPPAARQDLNVDRLALEQQVGAVQRVAVGAGSRFGVSTVTACSPGVAKSSSSVIQSSPS